MNMVDNMTKQVTIYSFNNQIAISKDFRAKNYTASGYYDPDF